MKKLLITFYFLLSAFYLFSQTSVVFNNLYNTIISNIKELPNGNFVFCQQFLNDVELTVINENGIKQDSLHFNTINKSYYTPYDAVEVKDNKIYLLLMEKDYTDTTIIHGYTFCKTNDGGFAISGSVDIGGLSYDAFILKTDSIGETQWYKEYGNSNKNECITKIIQNENNDYILSGYNYVYTNQKKWYLIRTDSIGNFVWDWTINNPNVVGNDKITDLIETQDSNYIAIGSQVYNDDVSGYGTVRNAHLIKLDINKNILSDKIYYEPLHIEQSPTDTTYSKFQKIIQKPNGNYVVIGERQYTVNASLIYNQTFLYELDNNFNIIKKRKYAPATCSLPGTEPLGLTICNDGGIAMVINADFDYETPHQKVWFVKTDTNYCDGVGSCDTTISIQINIPDSVTKKDTIDISFEITSNIDIPYEVWLLFRHKNYQYCTTRSVNNVSINTINHINISYDALVNENFSSSTTTVGDTMLVIGRISPINCADRGIFYDEDIFMLIFTDGVWVKPIENPVAKLNIYPNPTKTSISLMFTDKANVTEKNIFIYDVFGRKVLEQSVIARKNDVAISIDVSSLPKGVYFVRVGGVVGKFVKE